MFIPVSKYSDNLSILYINVFLFLVIFYIDSPAVSYIKILLTLQLCEAFLR